MTQDRGTGGPTGGGWSESSGSPGSMGGSSSGSQSSFSGSSTGTGTVDFPIDDATYNLLQALTSKLESIDAYRTYMQDDPSGIFQQLAQQDAQHAKQLLESLREHLGGSGGSSYGGSSGGTGTA